MKNYANPGIVRQQKRNSRTKYDLMREEHCAGLARDLKTKYILKAPTKNTLSSTLTCKFLCAEFAWKYVLVKRHASGSMYLIIGHAESEAVIARLALRPDMIQFIYGAAAVAV